MKNQEALEAALAHIKDNNLAYLNLLFELQEEFLLGGDNGTMNEETQTKYRSMIGNLKEIINNA